MRKRHALPLRWLIAICIVFMSLQCWANAQESSNIAGDDPKWTRSAEYGSHSTWYSKDNRTIHFPEIPSDYDRDMLKDRSKKVAKPRNPSQWNWNWDFMNGFWETLAIIGIAGILLGVITALLYFFWSDESWNFSKNEPIRQTRNALKPASLKDLPFQVEATAMGTLDAAKIAMENGDFSRAIIYLFSHILLELDSHHRIRLQRGKTNGMYLREVRSSIPLHAIVQRIANRFEQSFFGNLELNREQFMECWEALDEFDKLVASKPVEATA